MQMINDKKSSTPPLEIRASYFVSFSSSTGFGQATINRTDLISSGDEIVKLSEFIQKENNISGKVAILNWRQFDPPMPDCEGGTNDNIDSINDGMSYFVSFASASGFGHSVVRRKEPISSGDEIVKLSEFIQKVNNISGKVVILNWRHFDSPLT